MLRPVKDLEKFRINATDGEVGQVSDFYFEDNTWVVRYVVVETGAWLLSRKVLISPILVHQPDWHAETLPVSITKEQVKNSPDFDTDKPVSRQNEEQFLNYYGYPAYWGGIGMWGEGLYPYAMVTGPAGYRIDDVQNQSELEAFLNHERNRHRNDDPHLRSCNAVTGYHIQATDGEIGHVSGFLLDDQTWAIRYLIIDTSNWWLGHKVLIAPIWITGVSWANRTVSIDVTQDAVRRAPVFEPQLAWTREKETALYQHYRRSAYWAGSATPSGD